MELRPAISRVHGGADAGGAPRWDFSTCANAAGPCPAALAAVRAADPTRYPDPAASAVRQALAALHGVAPWRVLPAASASEFIQRFTAVTGRLWPGPVQVPRHAYGDYAAAALACGRALGGGTPTLQWHAEPSSPLGHDDTPPPNAAHQPTVLDAVYAPLRLEGHAQWNAGARDTVFVLHSPNKALGLAGVRGAYAVAPRSAAYDVAACCRALESATPSWPLSAQADAMLVCWGGAETQAWVAGSRITLAAWKAELQHRLAARGFAVRPSVTPHFVVRPPRPLDLALLRRHGVAVRDATSFGLAGCWRVSAQPPDAQDALTDALDRALEAAP
jgi:histidinol-phosphate aminotransferase